MMNLKTKKAINRYGKNIESQTKENTYCITFNKTISTNLRPYDKIFKRNRKSNVVFKQINFQMIL